MRSLLLLCLGYVMACTKPNPAACCATGEQCAALGVDDLRPCEVGQACGADFTCVAAECATSGDCVMPGFPVCSLGLCVSTCRVDADCADVADRPFCAADGVCVGCVDASTCPVEAAFCDVQSRACRGCLTDAQCDSGICIEAEGVCVDQTSAIYVSTVGSDVGTCTESAPCASIAFALQLVTANRPVIRVLGGQLVSTGLITLDRSVTIDGAGTILSRVATGPLFDLPSGPAHRVIVEGVGLQGTVNQTAITVGASQSLRLFLTTLDRAAIQSQGTLSLERSTLKSTRASCISGAVAFEFVEVSGLGSGVDSQSCVASIRNSRFVEVGDRVIGGAGGVMTITNNLFVLTTQFADLIQLFGHTQGSVMAFNTIVNLGTVTNSPDALRCDSTVRVTSNIFAYNSTDPLSQDCVVESSLFDLPGAPQAGGNLTGDASTFFVDRASGDFHPAAGSPALQNGEPGVVSIDLEERARATMPAIGALEPL